MKKLVTFLVIIGLTNLTYAQNNDVAEFESKNLNSSSLKVKSINSKYLNKINDRFNSDELLILEKKVSEYDVTKADGYDSRNKAFKVNFLATKGSIEVIYDANGMILSTREKFKDVRLPVPVRHTAFKMYPDWKISGNVCSINYNINRDVMKTYKLKLTKGNKKATLLLDASGNKL